MKSRIIQLITHPRLFFAYFLKQSCFAHLFSDKKYIKLNYFLSTGERLDLDNPKTFREKIQWLKLYNRKSEYTKMVDKFAVKDYVKNLIGSEYLIPTLAVYNSVNDIKLDDLPSQFVLKTTNGGGNNGVIICKDKHFFNLDDAKIRLSKSLKFDIYVSYREWPYKNVPKKIIAEKFMNDSSDKELKDYKFFCFNGKVKFIQVIQNRRTEETIDFFDTDWNHQEFIGLNPHCKNALKCPLRPYNLDKMIDIANTLSRNIPFCRIDQYEINKKVYFGEITFFPGSGLGEFNPPEYDRILGDMIDLTHLDS